MKKKRPQPVSKGGPEAEITLIDLTISQIQKWCCPGHRQKQIIRELRKKQRSLQQKMQKETKV